MGRDGSDWWWSCLLLRGYNPDPGAQSQRLSHYRSLEPHALRALKETSPAITAVAFLLVPPFAHPLFFLIQFLPFTALFVRHSQFPAALQFFHRRLNPLFVFFCHFTLSSLGTFLFFCCDSTSNSLQIKEIDSIKWPDTERDIRAVLGINVLFISSGHLSRPFQVLWVGLDTTLEETENFEHISCVAYKMTNPNDSG